MSGDGLDSILSISFISSVLYFSEEGVSPNSNSGLLTVPVNLRCICSVIICGVASFTPNIKSMFLENFIFVIWSTLSSVINRI